MDRYIEEQLIDCKRVWDIYRETRPEVPAWEALPEDRRAVSFALFLLSRHPSEPTGPVN